MTCVSCVVCFVWIVYMTEAPHIRFISDLPRFNGQTRRKYFCGGARQRWRKSARWSSIQLLSWNREMNRLSKITMSSAHVYCVLSQSVLFWSNFHLSLMWSLTIIPWLRLVSHSRSFLFSPSPCLWIVNTLGRCRQSFSFCIFFFCHVTNSRMQCKNPSGFVGFFSRIWLQSFG